MRIEPITYHYDNGPPGHGFVVVELDADDEDRYLFHGQTREQCEKFVGIERALVSGISGNEKGVPKQ